MRVTVEQIGERMGIFLSPEQAAELGAQEGTVLCLDQQQDAAKGIQHIPFEEGMQLYRQTESEYREVYQRLAQ